MRRLRSEVGPKSLWRESFEEPWDKNATSGEFSVGVAIHVSPLAGFWYQDSSKDSHYISKPGNVLVIFEMKHWNTETQNSYISSKEALLSIAFDKNLVCLISFAVLAATSFVNFLNFPFEPLTFIWTAYCQHRPNKKYVINHRLWFIVYDS